MTECSDICERAPESLLMALQRDDPTLADRIPCHNGPVLSIIDCGASSHMAGDKNIFSDISSISVPIPITLGDDSVLNATRRGSIPLLVKDRDDSWKKNVVVLPNVLFIPGFKRYLLSVSKLQGRGFHVNFQEKRSFLVTPERRRAVAVDHQFNI